MLFKRPDTETLYSALVNKDPAYEGVAYVCVTSTKIFCRFTCTARKPKPENCRFRETIAECLEAGFRPCKRCKPMLAYGSADPTVTDLLTALDMPELIASSEQEYESLALGLARDPARLAALRAKLGSRRDRTPLFDTTAFVRKLESAYERMWRQWQAGHPPRSFEV